MKRESVNSSEQIRSDLAVLTARVERDSEMLKTNTSDTRQTRESLTRLDTAMQLMAQSMAATNTGPRLSALESSVQTMTALLEKMDTRVDGIADEVQVLSAHKPLLHKLKEEQEGQEVRRESIWEVVQSTAGELLKELLKWLLIGIALGEIGIISLPSRSENEPTTRPEQVTNLA